MKLSIQLLVSLALISCTHSGSNPKPEPTATEGLEMVQMPVLGHKLRAGYSLEKRDLKACIIYLQGLADSIRNHTPLFSRLNEAGYRVIFFDYPGQGGSEGSMNNTRIRTDALNKGVEIQEQADFFWAKYKGVKSPTGQDCTQSPKIVMGWSAGGLAAYRMAFEKRADIVVLLAPEIHPAWIKGGASWRPDKLLTYHQPITTLSWTRNKFENDKNPLVDPIKPKSRAEVPDFTANVVMTAYKSIYWKIPPEVKGLALLSGGGDIYVSRTATMNTLVRRAPQFLVKSFEGSHHQLDNEVPYVAQDVYENTIQFLDSTLAKDE